MLQQSHGTVVDNHLIANIGRPHHQQLNQLALSVVIARLQMLFQFGAGRDAIGVIEVEINGDIIANR